MSVSSVRNEATDDPILCTPLEAMATLKVGRATLYSLLNSGELESFTEGKSRKIIAQSIRAYVQRRLAAEVARRSAKS